MKLFISWSTPGVQGFASGLYSWIPSTRATVDTWVSSECLPAGNNFPDKIISAIKDCDACLALVSKENRNSCWINFETGLFFGLGKPVFAMLCGDISHKDLQAEGHPLAANGVNFTYPDKDGLKLLFKSIEGDGVKEEIIARAVKNSFDDFLLLYSRFFNKKGTSISGLIAGLDE